MVANLLKNSATSKKKHGRIGVLNTEFINDLAGNLSKKQSNEFSVNLESISTVKFSASKWDYRFLDLADHISTWSKDPSTKVGAVIVNDKNHIVSLGYNGFPRGVSDLPARYEDRELKYKFVCHAERNAIDNAHTDISNCTLYVNLMPCNECAKSIIQRGIKRVVCKVPTEIKPYLNWDVTKTMFQEAGIQLDLV